MKYVIVFKNQGDSVEEVMGPINKEGAIRVLQSREYVSHGEEKKYWSKSPGFSAVVMPLTPAPEPERFSPCD